jgi:hypothetical protein
VYNCRYVASMIYCAPQSGTIAPAQQASDILRAWICQDDVTVRKELKRCLDLCRFPEAACTLEGEQLELLHSIVDRLDKCTPESNGQSLDPIVRICINLLLHLAAQAPMASLFTTEFEGPRLYPC